MKNNQTKFWDTINKSRASKAVYSEVIYQIAMEKKMQKIIDEEIRHYLKQKG